MRNFLALTVVVAMGLAGTLAGCTAPIPQSAANPYPPAPAVQAEVIPKPPVSEDPLIWQPGHWDWTGGSYVWTPGAWEPREGHGTSWQDGYWSQGPGGQWVWIPAHWL
jgi:hypothetical protein